MAETLAKTIFFPDGLVGCDDWKHFELQQPPEMAPIALLQSLDEPRLSFIVADPRLWYPHYAADLTEADAQKLALGDASAAQLLCILTVEAEPFQVTANLLGPLVINPATGQARQVIQSNRPYLARQPLSLRTQALTFADGLVGCPGWRHFILRQTDDTSPVKLLVSQDLAELSLPVVSPLLLDAQYAPQLLATDRVALGVIDDHEVEWLTILTVQAQPPRITANLLGPLAYNPNTGAARQVVLAQSGYAAAHPVGEGIEQALHALEDTLREVSRVSANATP